MNKEEVVQVFRSAKIKATNQRIAVYMALCEKGHASAESIASFVRSIDSSITVATVYRVLDFFVQCGFISRLSTSCGKIHYDVTSGIHHHLYHSDGSITDYDDSELSDFLRVYFSNKFIDGCLVEGICLQVFLR